MALDLNLAIQYGCCVLIAEGIAPSDLTNRGGTVIAIGPSSNIVNYNVVASIYGNDLDVTTKTNTKDASLFVSFGLVLQSPTGEVVIAIRGTNGFFEWLQDADFPLITCPFLAGAGKTEMGFTDVYQSLCMAPAVGSTKLVSALAGLPFPRAVTSVTICGHSLGGALVTLLGLDVGANTPYKTPAVYSYASPRTGDPQFVATYNQVVTNSFRFANRFDVVPGLPPAAFGYGHVDTFVDLKPGVEVSIDPLCRHHLTTYLYVLGKMAGVAGLPLNKECKFP
jgi:lipase (class 3)